MSAGSRAAALFGLFLFCQAEQQKRGFQRQRAALHRAASVARWNGVLAGRARTGYSNRRTSPRSRGGLLWHHAATAARSVASPTRRTVFGWSRPIWRWPRHE